MAEVNFMKILETCKVIPADSPSKFSLPLTFLDRIWLQTNPTSRLFFYEFPEPTTDFLQTILPKLKRSLSLTLHHFLPLSGNLTWPQDSILPVLQYSATDGDGVDLTVAETSADFDYLSGNNFRESADLRSLLPDFPSSETLSPAMTIQITLFPNRGFSMAYVAHHAIMDGKSTSMFLHLWAYICKNGHGSVLPPELIPSIDRTSVEQQKALEKVYPKGFGPVDLESKALKSFDMSPPSDTVLGTFKLTRENIEVLRNKAKSSTRLSTFTITSAYVGSCLVRAKKITADFTYLGFSVDCRLRLEPPLPLAYFGNCIFVNGAGRDTKDYFTQDSFVTAVNVFTEALSKLNEGLLKAIEQLTAMSASALASKPKSYAAITIGGSPWFELYKVDFGLGKPRKAEMISIDKGQAFYLSDDRDGNGGIEIGVALKKHETEAFASLYADGLLGC